MRYYATISEDGFIRRYRIIRRTAAVGGVLVVISLALGKAGGIDSCFNISMYELLLMLSWTAGQYRPPPTG